MPIWAGRGRSCNPIILLLWQSYGEAFENRTGGRSPSCNPARLPSRGHSMGFTPRSSTVAATAVMFFRAAAGRLRSMRHRCGLRHETFAQLHKTSNYVIPAKAGIQHLLSTFWIPVSTGMTNKGVVRRSRHNIPACWKAFLIGVNIAHAPAHR